MGGSTAGAARSGDHAAPSAAGAFASTTWSLTGALAVTASARANWSAFTLRDQLGPAFEDDPRFASPGAPRAAWIGVEARF